MGVREIVVLFLLLRICSATILDDRGQPTEIRLDQIVYDEKEKIHRASLGKDETVQMVRHWLNQGYTSLFSAFANKRVHLLTNEEKREVNKCTNQALAMNQNARCVLKVMELTNGRTHKPKKERNLDKYSKRVGAAQPKRLKFKDPETRSSQTPNKSKMRKNDWVGSFRVFRTKRSTKRANVVRKSSYNLISKNENESSFGEVGRRLTKTLRILKNKDNDDTWQQTLRKLSQKAKEMRIQEKFKKTIEKKFRTKDANTIFEDDDPLDPADDLFPNLESMSGRKETKALKGAMNFARDGVKLGMMLTKQNITGFDKKTLRISSPRFLSIVPEENPENTVNILSPSLLSLHNEGEGVENLTSVPKLMNGFKSEEREQWLNFIIEASGVSDSIQKMDAVKETPTGRQLPRDQKGKPYYITKEQAGRFLGSLEERKIDVHLRLKRSYTPEQIKEMNTTGYTSLNKEQIHIMYGPDSPYHCNETYVKFMNLSKEDMEQHILENVRMAAEMDSFNVREKDLIASPVVLTPVIGPAGAKIASQPMILSPVLLSPLIEAPAVFGILVLTPWLFVPVILSPRLMGSLILSPFVLSPVVLSPLMMHPVILSPGVMDPLILSPMAMVPFILSPLVMCPGVLSPLLLTPFILTPGVMSPFILSPMLLDPMIYSPQLLFGVILSPYALSPIIHSPSLMHLKVYLVITFGFKACSAILTDKKGKTLEIKPEHITYDADNKIHRAHLDKDDTYELMNHWLNQGYSNLYSAFANKKLHLLTQKERKIVNKCTSQAFGATESAKCVLQVIELTKGRTERPRSERNFSKYNRRAKGKSPRRLTFSTNHAVMTDRKLKDYVNVEERSGSEWVGPFRVFRAKRSLIPRVIVRRENYTLVGKHEKESAFGEVGRRLTKTLKLLKNKNDDDTWDDTMHKLNIRARELRVQEKFTRTIANKFLRRDTNSILDDDDFLDPTDNLFPELSEGIGFKDKKMFHNVLGFARDGVKLGMMLGKQNTTNFDTKTLRINSPRFLSVVPEQDPDNTINILSPSILSLHSQGKGVENLISMPKLMKDFREEERREWMNFIVEASGVSDAVGQIDLAQDIVRRRRRLKDDAGKQFYVTRENVTKWVGDHEARKAERMGQLMKTYTSHQLKELNETGYTVLDKDQLHFLYGPESPYNNSEAYNALMNISRHEIDEMIERDIRLAAEMESFKVRERDIVGSSLLFAVVTGPAGSAALSQNIILTPVVLSIAVEAPGVLGALVLSPLLFVPFVLSPRAVGALILSPFMFCPIVLNPFAIHPLILSPAPFDPFIITPLLLTPFILDPVLFTPGILSPFCLSPIILTPGVGSPFVLSPLLLSPIIFSPQVLFAVILTPYALSPIIQITLGLKVCTGILTDNKGRALEIKPEQIFYDEEKQVHRAELGEEDAYKLMDHWMNQGYSTLYSAFANKRLHLLTEGERKIVNKCTSSAFGAAENAKCVLKVIELTKGRTRRPKKERNFVKYSNKLNHRQPKRLAYPSHGEVGEPKKLRKRNLHTPTATAFNGDVQWVGSFGVYRAKRWASRVNITQSDGYTLIGQREKESPFGEVGRRLTKTLRLLKNKTEDDTWEHTMNKLDQRAKELRIQDKFRKSITNKFMMRDNNGFFEQDDVLDPADNLFPDLEAGLNRKDKRAFQNVMNFARDGVKLGMMLAKQNTSNFDRKTVKINSPRFLSVVPEEDPDNTINILSPSILSLHNQGKGVENLTSVPKLMHGFRAEERDQWMNFIIEASGVSDAVEKIDLAEDFRHHRRRLRDDSGKQLFLTKDNMTRWVGDYETRKLELQGRLMKTYTKQQLRDLNATGYTILNKDQLYMLYGPESPYNNSEAYNRLINVSKHEIDEVIERDIRLAAEVDSFKVRKNDIVGSSFLFAVVTGPAGSAALSQNIILTPILLSIAVEAPAVVGSVVLSPLAFVPFVLSPRAVGSIILSPFIFCPIVLNPLAVHPIILSPAVFDPFILTPLLLTPFILDPVVFTPGILAPLCLSPLILDPGFGSPFILSPLLLSPIIFSPQTLFAVILTPYALSPIVQSPFILTTILLSPGFLS